MPSTTTYNNQQSIKSPALAVEAESKRKTYFVYAAVLLISALAIYLLWFGLNLNPLKPPNEQARDYATSKFLGVCVMWGTFIGFGVMFWVGILIDSKKPNSGWRIRVIAPLVAFTFSAFMLGALSTVIHKDWGDF